MHYSPGIPLRINAKKPKEDEAFLLIKKRKITLKNYYYLSKKNNLQQSAKNLYTILRKITYDIHVISTPYVPLHSFPFQKNRSILFIRMISLLLN